MSVLVLVLILCFAVSSSVILVEVVVSSVIWSQSYQKVGGQGVSSMVQTSDGGFAMTGSTDAVDPHYDVIPPDYGDGWFVKTDEFGNMKWNKTYGGDEGDYVHSLTVTSDGGFALAGHTESFDARYSDFWLVKIDAQGNVKWNYTYGLTYNDYGYSLIETSDGGFAIAGYTSDSHSDFWLVKTNSSGNMLWNKTYGGDGLDRAYSVIESSDRGFLLAGKTKSFGFESIVYWLVKTDSQGNVVLNQTYAEEETQSVGALIETSDGGFAIGGSTHVFDRDGDFWLLKTDEYGIPEFPSLTILPLIIVTTLVVTIARNKLIRKGSE